MRKSTDLSAFASRLCESCTPRPRAARRRPRRLSGGERTTWVYVSCVVPRGGFRGGGLPMVLEGGAGPTCPDAPKTLGTGRTGVAGGGVGKGGIGAETQVAKVGLGFVP